MSKENLEELKKEIAEIKEEGNVEEIKVEKVDDEFEEKEINMPTKRSFKNKKLQVAAVLAMLGLSISTGLYGIPVPTPNSTVIEAQAKKKKDKKKPVIKFAGNSNISVEKGEYTRIPKTTAKDNKDGNVTKKIKVAVKRGNTSYASIAKKVKDNRMVKFDKAGKYVITYTVKDKAGNTATKKRYVTVKNSTTQAPTTEAPTTEAPSRKPVRRVPAKTPTVQPTTEAPATTESPVTTEAPTTESPVITNSKPLNYSDYNVQTKKIGNYTYKVTNESKFTDDCNLKESNDNIKIYVEKDFEYFNIDRESEILNDTKYVKFLGKITAYDANGNDISDSIIINEELMNMKDNLIFAGVAIDIYAQDKQGNCNRKTFIVNFCNFDEYYNEDSYKEQGYSMINSEPLVYGKLREKEYSLNKVKTLSL